MPFYRRDISFPIVETHLFLSSRHIFFYRRDASFSIVAIYPFLSSTRVFFYRFSVSLFIEMMHNQPRFIAQHNNLITQCRLMSLDLLAAPVNVKTIDGIVSKISRYFRASKGQLLSCVVETYTLLSRISCGMSRSSAIFSRRAHCFDAIASRPCREREPVRQAPAAERGRADRAPTDRLRVHSLQAVLNAGQEDRVQVETDRHAKLDLLSTPQNTEIQDIASLTGAMVRSAGGEEQ
jgi:hypothetical protein